MKVRSLCYLRQLRRGYSGFISNAASALYKTDPNADEMGDSMKSLENKTSDSKRQIDIDVNLDELKSKKARQATVGVESTAPPEWLRRLDDKKTEELEDEALVKALFFRGSSYPIVKRIHDNDDAIVIKISENKSLKRSKFFEEKATDLLAELASHITEI
ncbi:hypothetical protein RND71_016204 [Anisodus tanguticus]|uniref:Uncharacterized protein n=1 Tax=Anisodus tanguticus TaxID=243964 RepID=A0AAE1S7Q7_9SOLA|nr:hypothetical protein RND71_016204 [Anisodus tanguticus]